MSDVGKVQKGPSEEPFGPKRKKEPSSDEFSKMMRVDKVRETDPEEKKKKKSQAEAEEELKDTQTKGPSLGQGLGAEEGDSIFASEGASAPPLPPTEGEPPPPAPPPPSYFPEEPEPIAPPETTTPAHKKKRKERKEHTPVHKKKAVGGPAPKTKVKKKAPAHPPVVPPKQKKEPAKVPAHLPPPKKVVSHKPVEKKKTEELEEAPPPLPDGAWESSKELEKQKLEGEKPTTALPTSGTPLQAQAPASPTAPLAPIATPFANLHPQVQQVFERMVGVMTVMDVSGIKETTINLDNPQFKGSAFFGAQIIVSEYETAPKAFNIEILGNQRAVELMAANEADLVAAFAAGKYTFNVNRIETGYLPSMAAERKKAAKRVKRKQT